VYAHKNRLTLHYRQSHNFVKIFTMFSSQNHYSIEFDTSVCTVYKDETKLEPNATILKHDLPCLHVIIDPDVAKRVQRHEYKPHGKHNSRNAPSHDTITEHEEDGVIYERVNHTYELEDLPAVSGVSPEYVVSIHVTKAKKNMYDADFLRCHKGSDWLMFADDFWLRQASGDYVRATEYCECKVTYKRKPPARPSAGAAPPAARQPLGYRAADASLLFTAEAASDGHLPELANIALLAAQAPAEGEADVVAARPQKRMKKIKFLQPDAPAGDPMQH
jgi:hypothetical protein